MEAEAVKAGIHAGNTKAFEQIVDYYQLPIIRYLLRLTGDYNTAQDLAQETFINAYKNIHKTDSDLKLKSWLYRIATNNAMQYHRRKKILSFISFESMGKTEFPDSNNRYESTIENIKIQETLRKIPAGQRTCLILHYVEGFKYREIAETLQISEKAVQKRVSRGKQLFSRLYREGETQ